MTGARWFLPQFVIVVSGVLVALALNAWWASRQDARLEAVYLRQLAADLNQTEAEVVRVDSVMRRTDYAAGQLIRAFQLPAPPPRDSLFVWLKDTRPLEAPKPTTGTAEALVATGDLTLIQDDKLRNQILKYLNSISSIRERATVQEAEWFRAANVIVEHYDFQEILGWRFSQRAVDSLAAIYPNFPVPPGPRRVRFPFDREAFLSDRSTYRNVDTLNDTVQQFRDMRRDVRAAGDSLRSYLPRQNAVASRR